MRLTPLQIREKIQGYPGWEVQQNKLVKVFRFQNFPTAVLFINKLVDPAEEMNHHPEAKVNYDRVTVSLTTHDEGGITEKDLLLLERIEGLL